MIIRVEDLVESILKRRDEFQSIMTTEPDVVSVRSESLQEDLLYILETVPTILINRISINGNDIHISTGDINAESIDVSVEYDRAEQAFNAYISVANTSNSEPIHSMDDFIEYLTGKESGRVLQLHPYGILYCKESLSRYERFPSFLYDVPISFEDDSEQMYLYMFKDRNMFFEQYRFTKDCLTNQSLTEWYIPYTE